MPRKTAPVNSAREAALRALVRVEADGAYLNLALPALLQNLAAEERSLAMQLAAGTIQRLNTLDWALNLFSRKAIYTFTPWVRNLLRLSAYQVLYLDRIPAYAIVDEAVNLAFRYGHRGVAGLVNALLRRLAREAETLPWPDPEEQPNDYLSLKHSYPQWLIAKIINRYGLHEAEKWCLANNKKPLTSIRANQMRIKPEELIEKLQTEGVKAFQSPLVPGMLRVNAGASPALTYSFREGLFTIQGESSALAAPLLMLQPGDTVLDLCSAPGGKTTHLAELIDDCGLVYAVDLHENRLELVNRAARRLGLASIKTIAADGRNIGRQKLTIPKAVLVDAPCSGLGVLRRLPEIKWRRQKEDLPEMQKLQLSLLDAAARLLPPGGRLLYTVCSNEPEETVQVAAAFLSKNRQFSPEKLPELLPLPLQGHQDDRYTASIQPHYHDLDGFFFALWCKIAIADT